MQEEFVTEDSGSIYINHTSCTVAIEGNEPDKCVWHAGSLWASKYTYK